MEQGHQLSLVRLQEPGVFAQYIPENMREPAERSILVGAAFDGMACGAALAQHTPDGWLVRSIYVDTKARLCGLGTYLLRGLIGAVGETGARDITALYTNSMTEGGKISGCFRRAGFSDPQPYSAIFTIPLGKIATIAGGDRVIVESVRRVPELFVQEYHELLASGRLDAFADDRDFLFAPVEDCCLLAVVEGNVAGAIAVFLDQGRKELFLRGISVLEEYRDAGVGVALISGALERAIALFGSAYPLRTASITRQSYSLCDRLFQRNYSIKETLFSMTYHF